ncbi:MAG: FG-GAP repeat protein, partial [Acidobacteriota bacterium]
MVRKIQLSLSAAVLLAAPAAFTQSINFYYQDDDLVQENGDRFGRVVASGDFNGDGRGDIVIGAPSKDLDGVVSAGMVRVIYGDDALPSQVLRPEVSGWPLEQGLGFGTALVSMALTDDVYDELIIGVPGASVNGSNVGAIEIWIGGPGGLTYSTRWFQDESPPQPGARFGASLAAHDRKLFIGAPRAIVDDEAAGAVYYATWDPSFGFCDNGRIDQSTPGVPGLSESGDGWATSLATRAADGGGSYLLVGAPAEDIGDVVDAGAVWHLSVTSSAACSGAAASVASAMSFHQGDGAVPGS